MTSNSTFADIQDERTARAVIATVTAPGDFQTNHVLRHTGNGLDTLRLALSDDPIGGIPRADLHLWRRRFDIVDPEWVFEGIGKGERLGQRILIPGDPHWPTVLDPLDHRTPLALWAEGNTSLLTDPLASRAALVGSSRPSEYGAEIASELGMSLAADGRTIVTFTDRGISRNVIQGTQQESDRVILVLHHAINQAKPGFDESRERVAENGLLLSTLPPNDDPVTDPRAANRLLAAISGMTTVVEEQPGWDYLWYSAPVEAAHYGKPVGAVPGRVTDLTSQSTNHLIRDGHAHLVQSYTDITDHLDRPSEALGASSFGHQAPNRMANREHSLTR